MRTTAFVLVFALVVIACGQAPKLQGPAERRDTPLAVDAQVHERLQLGIPMRVELRAGSQQIGTCTVIYDLWDERFEVSRPHADLGFATEVDVALRRCVELPTVEPIRATELREPARPAMQYPVF